MEEENKPLVLVDCDGVLGDFNTPFFEIANRVSGKNLRVEDQDIWDTSKFFGLTEKQEGQVYKEICEPGWAKKLEPYPGAKKGMRELKKLARVHILTSPMFSPTWCHDRWEWLGKQFGILNRDVTHSHHKQQFIGDMLLDDKPKNVNKWAARHGPRGVGCLWVQVYNKKERDNVPYIATTWDDVHHYAETLGVYYNHK